MPSATVSQPDRVIRFTNCRLAIGDELVKQDLWISPITGKILCGQEVFFGEQRIADRVVDLGNRILSPGLIDVQMNGAFGTNFSQAPEILSSFPAAVSKLNKSLVRTGVTSYLPTLTSQKPEVYHQLLPFLGASGQSRCAADGSESLGAHCEGPFLSTSKNGCHSVDVLQAPRNSFRDFKTCYGGSNLGRQDDNGNSIPPVIKMITAAPELEGMTEIIPELRSKDIIFSIGHTDADYSEASVAVKCGATMITHLFNAMRPLHHRNPGVLGVLGTAENEVPQRPFFGLISDGIHLHPSTIKLAFSMHPAGCILVTDAMHLTGLEDGVYEWTLGNRIVKTGPCLTLEGSDKIAGSAITLIECVNNFIRWTGASVPSALKAVTNTPALMLGLEKVKGCFDTGADADLVVFSEADDGGDLVVDEVWKFGCKLHDRKEFSP